ncbi:hypothetical protein HMPREF0326_02679 [Desulfovibrio sp. 3_1_syn3]|uniref:hypothetical protein n=1 Tax=Desulfovibrio sp. 3_1_syn3 TaxID=457398 RepID=UPI0001E12FF7|nr:hypothetical protein [Desulfovibrio sp. 3_1_syn3]EFL84817.1 hypothetical protein HMPREF0326_02679 [Desulfovibrio sp. 3_1_syn3]
MKITITNDFHGTAVEVVPTETYTLESGQPCAVLPYTEYLRARKALCGMHDCSCLKVPGTGFGSDGVRYVLKFE